MPKHLVKFLKQTMVAENTGLYEFAKPEDFEFRAGQTMDLTLINPPENDAEGNSRTFSIVNAPYENNLAIATRLRSTAFKRALSNLSPGTTAEIEGPFGSFTLHNKAERPAVILTGGIGITPFYSIAKQAAHDKLPHKIYLFYSNRRPEDAAFLAELRQLEQQNTNFKLIPTMTQMNSSTQDWAGERGYIDFLMLKKYAQLNGAIYYIAGPPGMVVAMKKMLNEAGIDDDDIRFEEFPGY